MQWQVPNAEPAFQENPIEYVSGSSGPYSIFSGHRVFRHSSLSAARRRILLADLDMGGFSPGKLVSYGFRWTWRTTCSRISLICCRRSPWSWALHGAWVGRRQSAWRDTGQKSRPLTLIGIAVRRQYGRSRPWAAEQSPMAATWPTSLPWARLWSRFTATSAGSTSWSTSPALPIAFRPSRYRRRRCGG